jgi:hypothetical protein
MFSCLWILAEAKHPQHLHPSHKYKVTIYVESPTLSDLDVARQLSQFLPYIETETMWIYHNFLEVEILDEWPSLEIEAAVSVRSGHTLTGYSTEKSACRSDRGRF